VVVIVCVVVVVIVDLLVVLDLLCCKRSACKQQANCLQKANCLQADFSRSNLLAGIESRKQLTFEIFGDVQFPLKSVLAHSRFLSIRAGRSLNGRDTSQTANDLTFLRNIDGEEIPSSVKTRL